MSSERITPELAAAMEALRSAGRDDQRLSVIVAVEPPTAAGTATDVNAMAAAIRDAQQPVVSRLKDMGVTDIRRQSIASAIEAELTPAEIEALADEPTVRRVMSNRAVDVTTGDADSVVP